jgi:hypothetical protein
MVYALAPGSKTIEATSTPAEIATLVRLVKPNEAMSLAPLGTVAGVQFNGSFQSLLGGFLFQVALPA